jgi:hypothetical protein
MQQVLFYQCLFYITFLETIIEPISKIHDSFENIIEIKKLIVELNL